MAASSTDYRGRFSGRLDPDEERWFIVVLITPDGKADGALSRRLPDDGAGHPDGIADPFNGPWGLLTGEEAQELADAWTADPNDPAEPGTVAQVVEVYRFEGDPVWTEA